MMETLPAGMTSFFGSVIVIFLFILLGLTILMPFIIYSIRTQVLEIRDAVLRIEDSINDGLKVAALPSQKIQPPASVNPE